MLMITIYCTCDFFIRIKIKGDQPDINKLPSYGHLNMLAFHCDIHLQKNLGQLFAHLKAVKITVTENLALSK